MPNDYLVDDTSQTLSFHRPWIRRRNSLMVAGVIVLLACLGWPHHVPASDRNAVFITAGLFILVVIPFLLLCLYTASPFSLQFDLTQGTYEISDGCPPLRRTEQGTREDIACVYVEGGYERAFSGMAYQVLVLWKKKRRPSQLDWTADLAGAEQEAQDFARRLGVPLGETKIRK